MNEFVYFVIIVEYVEKLQALLTENESLRGAIPAQFKTVMAPSLDRVDLAFRPGLITIRWTSLGIEEYFKNVETSLAELSHLIKTVSGM